MSDLKEADDERIKELETQINHLLDQVKWDKEAADFLHGEGYERCDTPACNCGSWHDGKLVTELLSTRERAEKAEAQLPEGMKDCTIVFKECDIGHGWLTATNWVDFECVFCARKKVEAKIDKIRKAGRAVIYAWDNDETGFKISETILALEATLDHD